MIEITIANGIDEIGILKKLDSRSVDTDRDVIETVSGIIEDIRLNGDEALKEYSIRFDGFFPDRFELDRAALEESFNAVDERFRDAITRAGANIRAYHERQLQTGYEISVLEGRVLGQTVRGLDRVRRASSALR